MACEHNLVIRNTKGGGRLICKKCGYVKLDWAFGDVE